MKKNRIDGIRILHKIDEYPDLSWIGEYTDSKPDECDLKGGSAFYRVNYEYRGYKYFIPCYSVQERFKDLQAMGYSKGVAEELARSYCRKDFERMEGYCKGDWYMIGIIAKASICIPYESYDKIETISSGGLFGIESDSGDTYIQDIEKEQLSELKDLCIRMNVSIRNWNSIEIKRPESY